MNIDYLNRVGTAHNNFKTHEMRLNEENQNLKKEIEKLNYIIDKQDRDILALSKGNEKLAILIELIYNKVTLNEDQEELLNRVLLGSDKE